MMRSPMRSVLRPVLRNVLGVSAGSGTDLRPKNTVMPSIVGDVEIGETVTADVGTWEDADSISYSWLIGLVPYGTPDEALEIPNDPLLQLQTLTLVVTATNTHGSRTRRASEVIGPPPPMSMHITHISQEGTPLHASVLAADIQNAAPCFIPGQDFTLYNEVSAVSVIFTYDVGTNSYLVPADGDTPYTGASYNLLVLFIEVIEGGTTPCPVLLSQDGGCTSIPVILSQSPFVCYLGALGVWTPFCIPVEYYDDLEYADFTATGSDGSVVFTHIGEGAFMPAGPIPTGPYIMSQGAISFPTELLYTT